MAQHHDQPRDPPGKERRKEERDKDGTEDWESVTLKRVAGRVRSLDDAEDADEFGWERAVLERLRKRLDGG